MSSGTKHREWSFSIKRKLNLNANKHSFVSLLFLEIYSSYMMYIVWSWPAVHWLTEDKTEKNALPTVMMFTSSKLYDKYWFGYTVLRNDLKCVPKLFHGTVHEINTVCHHSTPLLYSNLSFRILCLSSLFLAVFLFLSLSLLIVPGTMFGSNYKINKFLICTYT